MSVLALTTVFLFAISPVGGLFAAVVAGVGFGMHPLVVLLVSVLSSALPALLLPPLYSLATLHPKFAQQMLRWRTEKAQHFFSRYGIWGMATAGRLFVGPYPAVMTAAFFGVRYPRIIGVFVGGALILALFFMAIAMSGLAALHH